ncbi:DUF7548 family protein [Halorussus amylolyticus]|uniref:DUF7548 family protein n=1 Tax=Halorussus amylolyticus TaxID=1126242 RepID=UPI00104E904A|nr:hypothetical protein [Halorussus amylolyticus]
MSYRQPPDTRAPSVGILASLAVLATVVAPFFLIRPTEAGVYYDAPTLVPVHLVIGVFASVAIIVFAAGRNGRTDPETAAGATVVLGGFVALLALWWAIAVGDIVGSLTENAAFDYHRWVLVAAAFALAGSAGWYAREVL